MDRARGDATFIVAVAPQFDREHRDFANAVVAAIAGHVFSLFDGVFGDETLGSDTIAEARWLIGVPTMDDFFTDLRSPETGVAYVYADESANVAEHDPFATDPDVIERGTRSHARLQNQLATELTSAGLAPLSPGAGEPPYDLAWRVGAELHVAEVKSTTESNEEHQLRLGLGQLLRYRHALSAEGMTVRATLYVERKPADPAWSQLCRSLGITLRWPGL
jgi:hypothetical protein